jgi:hypothetical protein
MSTRFVSGVGIAALALSGAMTTDAAEPRGPAREHMPVVPLVEVDAGADLDADCTAPERQSSRPAQPISPAQYQLRVAHCLGYADAHAQPRKAVAHPRKPGAPSL